MEATFLVSFTNQARVPEVEYRNSLFMHVRAGALQDYPQHSRSLLPNFPL